MAAPSMLLNVELLSLGGGIGTSPVVFMHEELPFDISATLLEWGVGVRLDRHWAVGIEATLLQADGSTGSIGGGDGPNGVPFLGVFFVRAPSLLESPRAPVRFARVRYSGNYDGSLVEVGVGVNRTFGVFRPELELKGCYGWSEHDSRASASAIVTVALGGWWEIHPFQEGRRNRRTRPGADILRGCGRVEPASRRE